MQDRSNTVCSTRSRRKNIRIISFISYLFCDWNNYDFSEVNNNDIEKLIKYEEILDKQGAYDESFDSKKKEAEIMNSYLNVLSLDRSVNLWAEAAKSKDEDLEPVKGSKTLTKKTQEKITINPKEKQHRPK